MSNGPIRINDEMTRENALRILYAWKIHQIARGAGKELGTSEKDARKLLKQVEKDGHLVGVDSTWELPRINREIEEDRRLTSPIPVAESFATTAAVPVISKPPPPQAESTESPPEPDPEPEPSLPEPSPLDPEIAERVALWLENDCRLAVVARYEGISEDAYRADIETARDSGYIPPEWPRAVFPYNQALDANCQMVIDYTEGQIHEKEKPAQLNSNEYGLRSGAPYRAVEEIYHAYHRCRGDIKRTAEQFGKPQSYIRTVVMDAPDMKIKPPAPRKIPKFADHGGYSPQSLIAARESHGYSQMRPLSREEKDALYRKALRDQPRQRVGGGRRRQDFD